MTEPAEQPYALATIRGDGSAEITIQGRTQELGAPTVEQARASVVSYLAHRARPLGVPIHVVVDDPEGQFVLVVNPDGSLGETFTSEPDHDTIPPGGHRGEPVDGEPDAPSAPAVEPSTTGPGTPTPSAPEPGTPDPTQVADPASAWGPPGQGEAPAAAGPAPVAETVPATAAAPVQAPPATVPQPAADPAPVPAHPVSGGWSSSPPAGHDPRPGWDGAGRQAQQLQQHSGWPQQPAGAPAPGGPAQPAEGWPADPSATMTRRQMRESFLKAEQTEAPASTGLRGMLARVGVRVQPSEAERAERADIHAVSQHWPGVRTIAVVNGKGGAGKTPTTALLSATFARYSGAATIAWDNNETRGTLGWRTEQGKHDATVLDLIPRTAELLDPGARAGDISHFVHHQAADKYDVLRSNPNLLSSEQRISGEDVDAIHDVLGRYYRLIFVDSGNDESASHWLRMIDKADQLVVPTIAKPEHAEAGALLLEALTRRGGRSADLAQRAVVVVSQAREKDVNPSAAEIARGFEGWVSEVVTIPYDRAMVENVLRYDALAPATRRAWLRAAAAVARRL